MFRGMTWLCPRHLGTLLLVAASVPAVHAAPLLLAAGTPVQLQLQHHVTSAYISAGSPIYFRVTYDVGLDGRTLIAAGTLVTGEMVDATNRGMVGRSGTMVLSVRFVPAVDGSLVPVDMDLVKQGRSRAGATLGWTILWGVPGLITRGVNPYLERGSMVHSTVLADVAIDPDQGQPQEGTAADTVHLEAIADLHIERHKFSFSTPEPFKFDIERSNDLGTLSFFVPAPLGITDPEPLLRSVELVAVDGAPVPVPIRSIEADATSFKFHTWSILQFCRDGRTRLTFRARVANGVEYVGEDELRVKIVKKLAKERRKKEGEA